MVTICILAISIVNIYVFLHTPNRKRIRRDRDIIYLYIKETAGNHLETAEKAAKALSDICFECGVYGMPEVAKHDD